jgi:hypothetical protein
MTIKFPPSSGVAKARYRITVRYEGMKRDDPMRNIAKWEKRPLGGLGRIMISAVSAKNEGQ